MSVEGSNLKANGQNVKSTGILDDDANSPNEIVLNLVKMNQSVTESATELESISSYSNDSFLTIIINLFHSLTKVNINANSMIFYFYHSVLVFMYLIMSIFRLYEYSTNKSKLRFFNLAYNPSRTPNLINDDINKLPKIPLNLAIILNYRLEQEENGGVEGLCNDSSEVITWCLSSGIPNLTIYEYHGILKKNLPILRRSIYKKLVLYFGTNSIPTFSVKIPHLNLTYYGSYDDEYLDLDGGNFKPDIEISLLSSIDGRATIVELTKVMSDLSKNNELNEKDVNLKFIDRELKQLVGKEPDLIVLFQPFLNLQGYPPWHLRLSEMYWEPDNEDVSYAVFLRALQKYSTCKVNIGR